MTLTGLRSKRIRWAFCLFALMPVCPALGWEPVGVTPEAVGVSSRKVEESDTAAKLLSYYEAMSAPKPFLVRRGDAFEQHREQLRERLLQSVGLSPLPQRVPLDIHASEPLDHAWCTARRVAYQLWPGVYSTGLLYMPKELAEKPAPAMLCPHGHWQDGNAHPEVQKRCLWFARLGYVTFSTTQNHYEDLAVGVSHQTVMIWTNMRALDYLESLPEVDRTRIGAAGASGGGLQTQMITALDPRIKAASIVGLTCDFRRIMFPDRHHCTCNHFPGVMQFTDHPEISALGMPAPIQFLTMNDWTKDFAQESFPAIRALYEASGHADRTECRYFDTGHSYDRPKRQETYRWIQRWLRQKELSDADAEPADVPTFPAAELTALKAAAPEDRGFAEIGKIYERNHGYRAPDLSSQADWQGYRREMIGHLERLLGLPAALPPGNAGPVVLDRRAEGGLAIERVAYPSEGMLVVPAFVVRRDSSSGRLPVVVMLAAAGKDSIVMEEGPESAREIARGGALVVAPDLRCYGELFSTGGKDENLQRQAWERNGIVWGRPAPGMSCTDLAAVLNGLAARPDADMARVRVVVRGGGLAIAAVFAAVMDGRISEVDADFGGCCFRKRDLPLVPFVLRHGDVYQWAAILAHRRVTLRGVPPEAGNTAWIAKAFALADNSEGLAVVPK
ncbi:MAG: acetylxylan esterase [Pirellulales bacterium]|nr:acetylxylan esterase [Pirellulales bacterium]